jgi:hypothetical protein
VCTGTILGVPSLSGAQEETDVAAEIKRIRKELLNVQEERSRVAEEKKKDMEDFEDYRKRTRKRMRQVRAETDSVKQQIEELRMKRDSLAALVNSERARKRQYELLQDAFRQALIDGCDRMLVVAEDYPPLVSSKCVSSLNLLRNELDTKAIDNIEGINRLVQVGQDMEEMSAGMQIVQGSSPVSEIRGTTFRIRIGTFFDAVVDAKGLRCAFWTGYDDNGGARWRVVSEPTVASQVLNAVNIREGKALPALVRLPITHSEDGSSSAEATDSEKNTE